MTTRLELVWPGKDKFLLVPKDESGRPVWVERDHPAASEVRLSDFTGSVGEVGSDPYADNLLFTGDSLDVLRILAESPEYRARYRGKVKLVYIDPPFNTGQAFEHYDDWMEHSTWLSFMRERLLLILELLAPDGSVWVHLDDAEQHRMRCLMDEIFGSENYVATVIWQKSYTRENRTAVSITHEYLGVFARNREAWSKGRNRLTSTEAQIARYTNPDGDPRGPWKGTPLHAKAEKGRRAAQFYTIETPAGRMVDPPEGRCWLVTRERYADLLRDGRISFGRAGTGVPTLKKFLAEVQDGLVPTALWLHDQVGTTSVAKAEIQAVAPSAIPFSTPKPEALLERVIHIGSNPGDVVLDCFAGSGTTAAVAQKMGRRWVTAELSPSTVERFTLPRLTKVVRGEDPGGITKSVGWAGGGGFCKVTVGPSMYEDTAYGVVLADWATNGQFARAVAGQLGFEWQPDAAPLCGVRGRMRLAVLDGAVGPEEVRHIVGALGEKERVTIVAKAVLPQAESTLAELSVGSRIRKAPRDLLTSGAKRMRRRTEPDGDSDGGRRTGDPAEGSGT